MRKWDILKARFKDILRYFRRDIIFWDYVSRIGLHSFPLIIGFFLFIKRIIRSAEKEDGGKIVFSIQGILDLYHSPEVFFQSFLNLTSLIPLIFLFLYFVIIFRIIFCKNLILKDEWESLVFISLTMSFIIIFYIFIF